MRPAKLKNSAKKTLLDWYEKAVNTLLAAEDQLRQGGAGDLKPLFRVIDDMTATIRNKGYEPYLLLPSLNRGLDPHACHSVNVGILCCILGEIYGLNSGQINSLCAYAFLHDVGRLTIPPEWTAGKKIETAEERELVRQHSIWGCLWLLFREDLPPQLGLLAAEHHTSSVGSGNGGSYAPDIFHKILAIADEYDLTTMSEHYYWKKHPQDRVLSRILNGQGIRHDPVLVKILANAVCLYPVGSFVQLDDGQRGIVVRPSGYHLSRPMVYLFEAPEQAPEPKDGSPEEAAGVAGSVDSSVLAQAQPEEAPPTIIDLTEVDASGTKFKVSITALKHPTPDIDVFKILDRKKEYLLSHTL